MFATAGGRSPKVAVICKTHVINIREASSSSARVRRGGPDSRAGIGLQHWARDPRCA